MSDPTPDKVSKENSYTYWVKKDANFFNGLPVSNQPQKLDQPIIQQAVQTQGASHWNKSGTWEERKIEVKKLEEYLRPGLEKIFKTHFLDLQEMKI